MIREIFTTLLAIMTFSFSFGQEKEILLKEYDPVSIYNIPETLPKKAKFPVIDMHSHPYAKSKAEIEKWIETMDQAGIEKTIILTYQTGAAFDSIYDIYSKYQGRFEVWCGIDYTGYDEPNWTEKASEELLRCYKKGARGVGELGDKGEGLSYSKPTAASGMHIDDERMDDLLKKCGELGMPVNIHVAEPFWMYQPIDKHNDGLMNAQEWKVDTTKGGILGHAALLTTLENAVNNNPETTFIACHFANTSYDLNLLGNLLDKSPNLYADISARYAETAPIPRHVKKFFEKYQDRLLYGTDMGLAPSMYTTTFRILETEDEHFYQKDLISYHWPLNGFGLSNNVLKKVYYENARQILQ
ncbi:amidohydrolase family protein [Autumnicola musiva]|uniref:Amidohydrolase family protein n=1 Tax=Autumnicola musiva TaxID=3075589 RepID=A0ABU3DAR1_9FLAO|nr:amidohydrolase family protein [Zunongwangia sp. F117]MDT0678561.1 amidohydrolase family protein [Zunongwangia sp. F117]